jgi:hypothetical protein
LSEPELVVVAGDLQKDELAVAISILEAAGIEGDRRMPVRVPPRDRSLVRDALTGCSREPVGCVFRSTC